MGPMEIIGLEEYFLDSSKRITQVKCSSLDGKLLGITKDVRCIYLYV
jgi:hypothetical protein